MNRRRSDVPHRPEPTPRAEVSAVVEERSRELVKHAPCGIYTATPDGKAVRANLALLRLLGYEAFEDIRGLPTSRWYDDRRDYDAWMAACRSDRGVTTQEVAWRTRDERALTVRLTGPIASTDPTLGGVVDVWVEDVTAARHVAAGRPQAPKAESLGRVAGEIGHEFNNLIMVILGYADRLLENVDAAEPMHADLREIQKAGDRAAALTHRLLTCSRQQARDAVLERQDLAPPAEPSARRRPQF